MFCVIWASTFVCQILITQFGGQWFSTAPLSADQWAVCLGLGLSELLFGQLVATIPSKRLPKSVALLRGVPEPTPLHMHRHEEESTPKPDRRHLALSTHRSKPLSLWWRAVELIAVHVSVECCPLFITPLVAVPHHARHEGQPPRQADRRHGAHALGRGG